MLDSALLHIAVSSLTSCIVVDGGPRCVLDARQINRKNEICTFANRRQHSCPEGRFVDWAAVQIGIVSCGLVKLLSEFKHLTIWHYLLCFGDKVDYWH